MAQKVNPIAVRLNLNRKHESHWFSDYYYTDLLFLDVYLKAFLNSVRMNSGNKLGIKRTSKCLIQHYPKKSVFYLFFVVENGSGDQLETKLQNFLGYQSQKGLQFSNSILERANKKNTAEPRTINGSILSACLDSGSSLTSQINFKSSYKFTKIPAKKFGLFTQALKHILERNSGLTLLGNTQQNSKNQNRISAPVAGVQLQLNTNLGATQVELRHNIGAKISKGTCISKGTDKVGFPAAEPAAEPAAVTKRRDEITADNRTPTGFSSAAKQPQSLYYLLPTAEAVTAAVTAVTLKRVLLKDSKKSTQAEQQLFLDDWRVPKETRLKLQLNPAVGPCLNSSHPGRAAAFSEAIIYLHFVILLYWAHFKSNCLSHLHKAPANSPQSTPLFNLPAMQHLVVNLHSPLVSEMAGYPHFSHIQSLISYHNNTLTSIIPIQMSSIFQCASAVSQDICYKLEQKKTFRQICKLTFQEIRKHPFIKGLRISCSGRINGAEIAKTEWKQFGETSLHVFSDQIDFAYSKASTVYGILGVKVWICYR